MTGIASTLTSLRRAVAGRRPSLSLRRLSGCAAIALAVTLSGCAARMSVGSHVAQGLDVGRYRTFDWGPADSLPAGDPRLDQNPLFQDHVLGAVERQLVLKALTHAATGAQPDLLVHYHAVISPRLDVNRVDNQYGNCVEE